MKWYRRLIKSSTPSTLIFQNLVQKWENFSCTCCIIISRDLIQFLELEGEIRREQYLMSQHYEVLQLISVRYKTWVTLKIRSTCEIICISSYLYGIDVKIVNVLKWILGISFLEWFMFGINHRLTDKYCECASIIISIFEVFSFAFDLLGDFIIDKNTYASD